MNKHDQFCKVTEEIVEGIILQTNLGAISWTGWLQAYVGKSNSAVYLFAHIDDRWRYMRWEGADVWQVSRGLSTGGGLDILLQSAILENIQRGWSQGKRYSLEELQQLRDVLQRE